MFSRKVHTGIACVGVILTCFWSLACHQRSKVLPQSRPPIGLLKLSDAQPLEVGDGFDSLTGERRPPCIQEGTADVGTSKALASATHSRVELLSSLEEVERSTSATVSGSYTTGFYAANIAGSYVQSGKFNRYSTYLNLHTEVQLQPQILHQYHLTRAAQKAYAKGLPEFTALCGDQYVYGQVMGADLNANLRIDSSTQEERNQTQLALGVRAPNGDLSAAGQQALKRFEEEKRLSYEILRRGPNDALPSSDVASLLSYSSGLSEALHDDPNKTWRIALLIQPYKETLETSDTTVSQAEFVNWAYPYITRLYAYRNDLLYIRDHRDQFGETSDSRLEDHLVSVGREISAVTNGYHMCVANPQKCKPLTEVKNSRLPMHGNMWKPIDSQSQDYKNYFEIVSPDQKALQIRGTWHSDCRNKNSPTYGPRKWWVQFVSRSDLKITYEKLYDGHPIPVPTNSFVNLKVDDTIASDNCGEDTDKPEARAFMPVFPDDYPAKSFEEPATK